MNFKDIEILYEDNHLLVVNKPANILSQANKSLDNDLLSLMKEYIKVTYNKPNEAYLGLVHRLDRMVGGVMVFAKTSKAASRLSNQIRLNQWQKNYLVLVENSHVKDSDTLVDYLIKNNKTNTSYVTSKNNKKAKKSILEYTLIKQFKSSALLDVNLITGRHHQIRVQLNNQNMPILDDHRYNKSARKNKQIKLFAYKLSIIHPTLKHTMIFKANPPKEWNINNYI